MVEKVTSYQKFKKWCKEHTKEITVGVCFVLIFVVGFGTGRYDSKAQNEKRKSQSNYSKPEGDEQKAKTDAVQSKTVEKQAQVLGAQAGEGGISVKTECVIKGNISSTGSKIYHIKGGAFYDRTNPEQCFNAEEEARAAGFRKSSR